MSPSSPGPIRLGTRGSVLARTQTEWVAAALRRLGHDVEITVISTRGDATAVAGQRPSSDIPVARLGGDGVFVRELQRALLEDRIDLAVHSLKDLPTAPVEGLALVGVPARENPFDVLVGRTAPSVEALPRGAIVGTSSIRRVVQLKRLRPDIVVREIRGNVDTRLRRLDTGEYDAIVLAAAGLARLGLTGRVTEILRPDRFWPAVGQGALGLEARVGDHATRDRIAPLDDRDTRLAVVAERSCLAALAGGCLAPVAGLGRVENGKLLLGCCVFGEADGSVVRLVEECSAAIDGEPRPAVADGLARSAETLGRHVAARLEAAGATPLLEAYRRTATPDRDGEPPGD